MSDLSDLIFVVKQYGPFLVAVAVVMWRDHRREDRMADRINALETETRNVLLPLVEKTTAVVAHNTTVMERLERRLDT